MSETILTVFLLKQLVKNETGRMSQTHSKELFFTQAATGNLRARLV